MFLAVILGDPVPKKETRCKCFRNKPVLYDPGKLYSEKVRKLFISIASQGSYEMFKTPVKITAHAYVPIPKKTPKKNIDMMRSGEIRPDKRPDLDNYIYHLSNAGSGIFYDDDKRICESHHYKYYDDGLGPRVVFKVEGI